MYTGLTHLHSALRYLILLVLVLSFLTAIAGYLSGRSFEKRDKLLALFTLIFSHTQLLLGLVIYFLSPWFEELMTDAKQVMKEAVVRFYAIEHISMMIIAIALITIGYSRSKKAATDKAKLGRIAVFYGIALIIIFAMIPWPFLKSWGTWF